MIARSHEAARSVAGRSRRRPILALGALFALACGDPAVEADHRGAALEGAEAAPPSDVGARPGCFKVANAQPKLDPRRSLVVTEKAILARFTFQKVMEKLAAQSGGSTALALFQQWWDTQNPGPGLGRGKHCDDETLSGQPSLNGFPYVCRPAPSEGKEASINPFADPATNPGAYLPIGLFNRFDLAPADGSHCGEHRIVFARRSGVSVPPAPAVNDERNLVIFEAAIPNPTPSKGLAGCFPVAAFWASLSVQSNVTKRAEALEKFYFTGVSSFDENKRAVSLPPVLQIDNLGNAGRGQIRTNQFMLLGSPLPRSWNLREFHLRRVCGATGACRYEFVPVTVKTNPFGGLFDPTATDSLSPRFHPLAGEFQSWFPANVQGLLGSDVNALSFGNPDKFNTGQSLSSASNENRYAVQLTAAASPFRAAIQASLDAAGSALTPDDVALRAQTQSCAGCHQLNNVFDAATQTNNPGPIGGGVTWPASLRFVHVSEQAPENPGTASERFRISPALVNVFLPERARVMSKFLLGTLGCTEDLTKKPSVGGRRTH